MQRRATTDHRTYAALDGLRGVAAIAVVTSHAPDLFGSFSFRSAHLAVDLFFCLSGFVISHAYGRRLDQGLRTIAFMRIRLIRLYPLFLLSILLALPIPIVVVLRGHQPASIIWWGLLPALFFLPTPAPGPLYRLNPPAWSLFLELIVNLFAALTWRWLSTRMLLLVLAVSAVGLAWVAAERPVMNGGFNWGNFPDGVARVSFSFFAGLLLYRFRHVVSFKVPAILLLVGVGCVFAFASNAGTWLELAAILFVFPAAVALGAAADPTGRDFYLLAGRLSYGIYVLHAPLLNVARLLVRRLGLIPHPLTGLLYLLTVILLAWLADRYYDRPVRGWLGAPAARRPAGPAQTAF